jgi:lysylphosphatidylglycerol synthetase-like protein (DUF2156 family)
MEATTVRPGYELWRPNREKNASKATKVLVAIVLLASAALLLIITLGGWERLQGGSVGVLSIAWAALYILFAILVIRWNRGVLPVASALAILMLIFAAVSAPGWFDRDKDGLSSPALPEELIGLLVVIVIPVQLLLIAVAMYGFNQNWHVEEERPIGGGERPHDEDFQDRSPHEDANADAPAYQEDPDAPPPPEAERRDPPPA